MFEVTEYGPSDAQNTVFIFSGAGVAEWKLRLPLQPIATFQKMGWRVVSYEYPWSIIHTASVYLRTLEQIYADARKRLERLPKTGQIIAVGISLGSLPATRLATSSPQIGGLILNVPYADPITNLHDFGKTKKIPEGYTELFLASAKSEKKFAKSIAPFSPLQQARKTKHLKVLLFIAKKDKFFVYTHAKDLRTALQENAGKFRSFEAEHLGHHDGAVKFNLESRKWLEWLG